MPRVVPTSVPAAGKSLSTKIYFSIHMRTHTEKRPFACTECGKSFVKKGTLTAHKEIHKREKPFKCPDCSRCFGQSATLLAHQKIHLRGGPFICTECGKSLSTKRYFNVHQRKPCEAKVIRGAQSMVCLSRSSRLKRSLTLPLSQKRLYWNICFMKEVEPRGVAHPRNPSDPKSPPWKTQTKEEPSDDTENITAIACQKPYIKEEPEENVDYRKLFDPKIPVTALSERQVKKEGDGDGQHDWEVPVAGNRVLQVKEEPQESIEFGIHCGQRPNFSAIQRIQIKEEAGVEADHQQCLSPRRRPKKCDQPTKEGILETQEKSKSKKDLPMKGALKGERIFPCPECGKSFNQKSNLTRHRKIHTSEGPYKCSECGESFRMNRKLIRHQRLHMSEPFKCT
uniref:C2H2-type domain-containing protein n=1 Tax=Anas platyrhynchos TaxID=8839 RepID=A0A8B9R5R6_ANAPL